jgi:hypothetical protein
LIGTPEMLALGKRYDTSAGWLGKRGTRAESAQSKS